MWADFLYAKSGSVFSGAAVGWVQPECNKEMWIQVVLFEFGPGSQSASRNSSALRQMRQARRRDGGERQKENEELNHFIKLLPHGGVCRVCYSLQARVVAVCTDGCSSVCMGFGFFPRVSLFSVIELWTSFLKTPCAWISH